MFTKKLCVFIMLFALCICSVSCSSSSDDLSYLETRAGDEDVKEIYLDGDSNVITSGEPFTEEEILQQIDIEKESGLIPEDWKISSTGYYHVNAKTNCLDYGQLTLPFFQDGKYCGEMMLQRQDDGSVMIAKTAYSGDEDNLRDLLEANPSQEIAMVYYPVSELAILEDNTVNVISGVYPQISNSQNLYNAYNLKDNILCYETIIDSLI